MRLLIGDGTVSVECSDRKHRCDVCGKDIARGATHWVAGGRYSGVPGAAVRAHPQCESGIDEVIADRQAADEEKFEKRMLETNRCNFEAAVHVIAWTVDEALKGKPYVPQSFDPALLVELRESLLKLETASVAQLPEPAA